MAFLTSHLLVVDRVALSLWGTLLEQFALTAGCAVALCGLVQIVRSRQYLSMIGCNRAMFTFAAKAAPAQHLA